MKPIHSFFCTLCLLFFCSTSRTQVFAHTPSTEETQQEEDQKEHAMTVVASISTEAMTMKQMKRYLSGQKALWPDQTPVTIVLFPRSSPELQWLCTNIIRFPSRIYRRFVIRKAFRNGVNIVEVQTQEEALNILNTTPGAISPLNSQFVSETIVEIQQHQ